MESLVEYFIKLARPFAAVERVFFKEEKVRDERAVERALLKEAERIEGLLKPDDSVMLMSEHGPSHSTEKLHQGLEAWMRHPGRVCFVFGSARGLHPSLKGPQRSLLSLGPMTTQHELALVLWTEQLYRILTIRAGKRYHY